MTNKEELDNIVNLYKKLDIKDKKEEIINELKELIGIYDKLCSDLNIEHQTYINKELLDLNNENVSDEDFFEAVFVLILSLKELIGLYTCEITSKYYE